MSSTAGFRAGVRKDSMTAFGIDSQNNITIFASLKEIQESEEETVTFTNQEEFAALANKWAGGRLVEIWNSLPGVQPVERFTSRSAAVGRIWRVIQHLKPDPGAHRQHVRLKKSTAGTEASRRQRGEDTKTAKIIALLKRPGGASLKALLATTKWQAHTIRGFVSILGSQRRGQDRILEEHLWGTALQNRRVTSSATVGPTPLPFTS
jgi:hypothetical protein